MIVSNRAPILVVLYCKFSENQKEGDEAKIVAVDLQAMVHVNAPGDFGWKISRKDLTNNVLFFL